MARLTYAQRKKLPASSFAVPSERKYPIEDKAHARNAKQRVARFGTPAEKKAVARKVAKRYPAIGRKKG